MVREGRLEVVRGWGGRGECVRLRVWGRRDGVELGRGWDEKARKGFGEFGWEKERIFGGSGKERDVNY